MLQLVWLLLTCNLPLPCYQPDSSDAAFTQSHDRTP
jgi:hypothetical protein